MASYRQGMEKLFRGILKYGNTFKGNMVKQFKQVRDNPQPTAVLFTCVDSRMLPTAFMRTKVGDMFIVRNVGNIVPHSSLIAPHATSTEPAMLELGCLINKIQHVIVCGHSDCKAMNLLYSVYKATDTWTTEMLEKSPIRAWMSMHGMQSLIRYEELEATLFRRPLKLRSEALHGEIEAFIDPDLKLNETDKLSQVHVLIQAENIASYDFMHDPLRLGHTRIHAMWFDIYTGDVYYFSIKQKCFVPITQTNYESLLDEMDFPDGGGSNSGGSKKQLFDHIVSVGKQHQMRLHQEGDCCK